MLVWRPLAWLAETVASYHRISVHTLKSASRTHEHSLCRAEVFWLADKLLNLSVAELGRSMGGRDPSTVLSGIKRVDEKLSNDAYYASQMSELRWLVEIDLCGLNGNPNGVDFNSEARAIARSVTTASARSPDFNPHEMHKLADAFLKQSVRLAEHEGFAAILTGQITKFNEGKKQNDISHQE